MMKIGTRFPQGLIGLEINAVREYVQALEEMGYDYITASDHVLLPDVTEEERSNLQGAGYHMGSAMREPFVFLAYVAGMTTRLELVTSIIILPQRQTVLVAKQAAELDALSGGRLRLGVGLGRVEMEYEALGKDFHNRGKRMDEQIDLMRRLWTERSITYEGQWETVTRAGLNPQPVQRPIPIWMGGGIGQGKIVDTTLKRVARLADGWCPLPSQDRELMVEARRRLKEYVSAEGKDPNEFEIEMRTTSRGGPEAWAKDYYLEEDQGTKFFTVVPSGVEHGLEPHLNALRTFIESVR